MLSPKAAMRIRERNTMKSILDRLLFDADSAEGRE